LSASAIPGPREEPSRLVAPIWHTFLFFGLLFWLEYASHPGRFGMPGESLRALFHSRSVIFSFGIAAHCIILGLMYMGLLVHKSNFSELMGAAWGNHEKAWRDAYLGAAFSLVLFAVSFLFLLLFGTSGTLPEVLRPTTVIEFSLFLIFMVIGGISEELIFRGYLTRQLNHYLRNGNLVAILQAVVFAALHGPGQSLGEVTAKFVVGAFLGLLAMQRRSLVPGIVAHCCLNAIGAVFIML
jgi:membrane protease YdiL (CAAX protease family)